MRNARSRTVTDDETRRLAFHERAAAPVLRMSDATPTE
jgi:hypothetical protein